MEEGDLCDPEIQTALGGCVGLVSLPPWTGPRNCEDVMRIIGKLPSMKELGLEDSPVDRPCEFTSEACVDDNLECAPHDELDTVSSSSEPSNEGWEEVNPECDQDICDHPNTFYGRTRTVLVTPLLGDLADFVYSRDLLLNGFDNRSPGETSSLSTQPYVPSHTPAQDASLTSMTGIKGPPQEIVRSVVPSTDSSVTDPAHLVAPTPIPQSSSIARPAHTVPLYLEPVAEDWIMIDGDEVADVSTSLEAMTVGKVKSASDISMEVNMGTGKAAHSSSSVIESGALIHVEGKIFVEKS